MFNVNCIAPYYEWYEIGFYLNLPAHELDEILRGYPLADHKAHFVELWYRLDPEMSWEKLQQALECLRKTKKSQDAPALSTAEPPPTSKVIIL